MSACYCSMYRLQICIDCVLCLVPQALASCRVSRTPRLCLASRTDKACDKSAPRISHHEGARAGIFNTDIKYSASVVSPLRTIKKNK